MTKEERLEMINKMRMELVLRGLSCTIFTERREFRNKNRLFYIIQVENGGYLFQGSLEELRDFIKDYNRIAMEETYGDFGDSVIDYINSLTTSSHKEISDEELENDLKEAEDFLNDVEETTEIEEEIKELNNCDVEEYKVYQKDDVVAITFKLDNGKILMSKSDEWGKKINYKLNLERGDLAGFKHIEEDDLEFHVMGLTEYVIEKLLDFGVDIYMY